MNALRWPKEFRVKVLGTFWKVKVVDHPLEVEGAAVWGYKDSEEEAIVLSSKGNVVATLIHELEHVFAEVLRIPDETPESDAIIERIAQAVMAFFVDNNELMQAILCHLGNDVKTNKKYKGPRVKKAAAKRKRGRPPKGS